MSEPENFLTRWSRRKREEPDQPERTGEAAPDTPAKDDAPAGKPKSQATSVPSEPEFDPASLPSLDSIGAQTDIGAFLKPGVPGELRLAALRRAWSADPAIRDFKGLAENDWDFTAADSMRGFGDLAPGTDVKKMLAQMFGESPRADKPTTEVPAPPEQLTPPSQELSSLTDDKTLDPAEELARQSEITESTQMAVTGTNAMVRREENIAAQNDAAESGDAQSKRRRSQGSALPE